MPTSASGLTASLGWQIPGVEIGEVLVELRVEAEYAGGPTTEPSQEAARASCFARLMVQAKELDADSVIGIEVQVIQAGSGGLLVLRGTPVRYKSSRNLGCNA